MLHRAILGSFERFVGILIEHYAGRFPVWLAPTQAIIMGITDRNSNYSKDIYNKLKAQNYRVELDLRNEKIGFKIREHTIQKIPFIIIIGDKEEEDGLIAIRTLEGKDLGAMKLVDFTTLLDQEIANLGKSNLK